MASTYVNDLRLNEMATGDQSGSWGTVTNTNLELIAEAFSFGTEAITTNANTHTTTIADGGTDPGRSMFLKYTGTLDSACTITIGPNTVSKLWFIENGTSGSQNIIIKQGSGATITIPPGDTKAIYSDGAGSGGKMVDAFASLSVVDLNVSGNLDVDGTANLDAVDIDGAVQIDNTVSVGVDDTGYDVKFFGDTASAFMLWDASADDLILGGAAGLSVNGTALVTGVLTTTAATVHTNGITMPDSAKAIFGAESDLQIYHDGSDSYVKDNGTGNLLLQGTNLNLQSTTAEDYIRCTADAQVELYHNNALKLATAADGISVTGDVAITSGGTLDVFNSGNTSSTLTALFGADNGGGNGRTNSTTKSTVLGVPHYTNSEEAVALIVAGSTSASNFVTIGGGASVANAATIISFNTAANQTTTGGTARLTVNSAGDIDVETGDIFFSTAGKGIVLGATSNVAANTLSDYEFGTWTPAFVSGLAPDGTVSSLAGQYVKVGNLVTVYMQVAGSSLNLSSYARVQGLPFTASSSNASGTYILGGIAHRNHGWTTLASGSDQWYFSVSGSDSEASMSASITYKTN